MVIWYLPAQAYRNAAVTGIVKATVLDDSGTRYDDVAPTRVESIVSLVP
jgi:hypothetical protein